jgi:hypothetical protein
MQIGIESVTLVTTVSAFSLPVSNSRPKKSHVLKHYPHRCSFVRYYSTSDEIHNGVSAESRVRESSSLSSSSSSSSSSSAIHSSTAVRYSVQPLDVTTASPPLPLSPDPILSVPFDLVLNEAPTTVLSKFWKRYNRQALANDVIDNDDDDDDDDDGDSNMTEIEKRIQKDYEAQILQPYLSSEQVVLTALGAKVGTDVNQDFGFVAQWMNASINETNTSKPTTVMAVLDGHGTEGHRVVENAYSTMINRISGNIHRLKTHSSISSWLDELFVDVDLSLPPEYAYHGGAAVSMIVQQGTNDYNDEYGENGHVVVANSGDSQSIVAAVVTPPMSADQLSTTPHIHSKVVVLFESQLHQPRFPDEEQRIVAAGGSVQQQIGKIRYKEPRLVYKVLNEENGAIHEFLAGLSVSRGFGDWGATGVIPNPTITSFSIPALRQQAIDLYQRLGEHPSRGHKLVLPRFEFLRRRRQQQQQQQHQQNRRQPRSRRRYATKGGSGESTDDWDVQLFAIAATDGILEHVSTEDVASTMAVAFYPNYLSSININSNSINYSSNNVSMKQNMLKLRKRLHVAPLHERPLLAAFCLLQTAAQGWWLHHEGRYRDDMTVVAAKLNSIPPKNNNVGMPQTMMEETRQHGNSNAVVESLSKFASFKKRRR